MKAGEEMQAGELRQKIQLQHAVKTKDADGAMVTEFQTFAEVWAKANGLYGKEYWEAKAYRAETTVEFTIRYRSDLKVKDRILFQNGIYNISQIDQPFFRKDWLKIKAMKEE